MESLYQQYKNKKVKFFRINIKEDSEKVKDYARDLGLSFPILLD
ncbi:MAG: hypothetical protein HY730_08720, partial [Candidatus Tectomicrobia bacterium]|nr:hypothetical protein [Candidatus Tectomicrobia bacterium]